MQAMIDELAKQAAESLGQVSGKETLASFWQEYLSKNGKIPALMKNLRTVAPEERPAMGKIINELKQKVQADYDAAAEAEALTWPGVYYVRTWLNEGRCEVGDSLMYVLIGADIRPNCIDALQKLVGKIKNDLVVEKEIYA